MLWPEEAPDVIVDEFARAVVDFLVVLASATVSNSAGSGDVPVMEELVQPMG